MSSSQAQPEPIAARADQETINAMRKFSPDQKLEPLNTHMVQLWVMLTETLCLQFPDWTTEQVS
jgi:hypothetical protein